MAYEPADYRHPLLDVEVGYEPRRVDSSLAVSRVDGQRAMREYVHRNVPLPRLYDWLLDSDILQQFTEAAPGFEELMALGKVYDLVGGSGGARRFDSVVFDAPASGHCSLMLRTPRTTMGAVRAGPLYRNAQKIEGLLGDASRTCIAVVALAEEMAVTESVELVDYLRGELGFATAPMIVNRLYPQRFSAAEIEGLQSLRDPGDITRAAIATATAHQHLAALQAQYVATLRERDAGLVELPHVVGRRHDPAALLQTLGSALARADRSAEQ